MSATFIFIAPNDPNRSRFDIVLNKGRNGGGNAW
jgi:hypothetical protein